MLRACLVRTYQVDDPRTRSSPLLAPLPLAPPMPELLVDRSWSVLPEPLLATPPAILYDADV